MSAMPLTSHRAPSRTPPVVRAAVGLRPALVWIATRLWRLLRAAACRLFCTGWGLAVGLAALPALTALAVWLAWPDPSGRTAEDPAVRPAGYTDTAPCRHVSGGPCLTGRGGWSRG